MAKKICIIIPTYGYPSALEDCLNSILNIDYPHLEIIIIDDGLEDDAIKILDKFKDRIKILMSNSRGPSYARNLAAKSTDADFPNCDHNSLRYNKLYW